MDWAESPCLEITHDQGRVMRNEVPPVGEVEEFL